MLKALAKISDGLALNRLQKHKKNPCNGYKRLVHLMQSDWGRSIDFSDYRPGGSTGWIDRVNGGKNIFENFQGT